MSRHLKKAYNIKEKCSILAKPHPLSRKHDMDVIGGCVLVTDMGRATGRQAGVS